MRSCPIIVLILLASGTVCSKHPQSMPRNEMDKYRKPFQQLSCLNDVWKAEQSPEALAVYGEAKNITSVAEVRQKCH